MSDSAMEDLIVRMAVDDEFARSIQDEQGDAAERYGLSESDLAALRAMTVVTATARPLKLEERLSRSSLLFGLEAAGDGGGGDDGGGSKNDAEKSADDDGDKSAEVSDDDDEPAESATRPVDASDEEKGESSASTSSATNAPSDATTPAPVETTPPARDVDPTPPDDQPPASRPATAGFTATSPSAGPATAGATVGHGTTGTAPDPAPEIGSGHRTGDTAWNPALGPPTAQGPSAGSASTASEPMTETSWSPGPAMAPAHVMPLAEGPHSAHHGGVVKTEVAATGPDGTAPVALPEAGASPTAGETLASGRAAWVGPFRDAVTTALQGGTLPVGESHGEQLVNQLAGLVAAAANAGPRGLPDAPWADDVARFVLDALHIDPATVTPSASAAIDPAPVGSVDTEQPSVEDHPAAVGPITTPPPTTPPAAPAPDVRPPWAYRGKMIDQVAIPATEPNATASYRQFFADGSSRDVAFYNDDGGGSYVYTTADGTRVQETGWYADGSRTVWAQSEDGSVVSYELGGRTLKHTIQPDGVGGPSTTTVWSAPEDAAARRGAELFRIVDVEPTRTRAVIDVRATTDGGAVATVEEGDTTRTVRLEVRETPNADGTLTREYAFPDGRVEAFTFDVADRPVLHETEPGSTPRETTPSVGAGADANAGYRGGVVGERELASNPDGTTQVVVTYADGTSREVTRTAGDDGSVSDTYLTAEGHTAAEFENGDVGFYREKQPDGTTMVYRQWIGTTMTERVRVVPGGVAVDTTWSAPPPTADGEWAVGTDLFRVTDDAGYRMQVSAAADGGAVADIRTGDGLQRARLDAAEIENADGTLTRLYTFPDGRTEAFTFDPDGQPVYHEVHAGSGEMPAFVDERAAAVNGGYHGGLVRHEVLDIDSLGTETVRRALADGTVVEGTFSHETGFNTLTYPDGTTVTGPSWGDAWSTTARPDGTSTERTWDGLALTQIDRVRDGIVIHTSWGAPADGEDLFRVEHTGPGTESVETRVSTAADGGAIATITTGDLARTVRLEVEEIENVDGTLTRVFVFPDGRTEAFTVDEAGRAVHHEAHAGPGATPTGEVIDPATSDDDHRGGVVREEVTGVDEQGRTTLLRTFADGTELEVVRASVGDEFLGGAATNESWTEPDGTRVLAQGHSDGTGWWITSVDRGGASTLRAWEHDGALTERRIDAHGTETRVRVPAGLDPQPGATILATTQTAAVGLVLQTSVVATPDGGAMASAVRSDGAATTVRLAVLEVENADGTRTRVFTFPDGRDEAVTYDATGRPVGYEGVTPGQPAAAGDGGPEGGRTEVTTGPDGSWTSTVTDGSRTLTTAVNAAGVVTKTITTGAGEGAGPAPYTSIELGREYTTIRALGADGDRSTVTSYFGGRTDQSSYDAATGETTTTISEGGYVHVRVQAASGLTTSISELRANGTSHEFERFPDTGADENRQPGEAGKTHVLTLERETLEGGGAKQTTTDSAGNETTTYQTEDGFTSQYVEKPNGAWEAWSRSPDGSFYTESYETRKVLTGWNESTGQYEYSDIHSLTTKLETEPDGSWVETVTEPERGEVRTTTYEPAGPSTPATMTILTEGEHESVEVELNGRDDSRVETTTRADGTITTRNVAADGTWTSEKSVPTTGHTITTSLDRYGTLTSTDTAPDGTYLSETRYEDGRRTVVQYFGPQGKALEAPDPPQPWMPKKPPQFVYLTTIEQRPDGTSTTRAAFTDGKQATITVGTSGADPSKAVRGIEVEDAFGKVIGTSTSAVDRPAAPDFTPPEIPAPTTSFSTQFATAAEMHGKLEGQFQAGPLEGGGLLEGTLAARMSGQASASVDGDGVDLSAGGEGYLGASGRMAGSLALGDLSLTGEISGAAEIYARALATASFGVDGITVGFDAEAMVSAYVEGMISGELGPLAMRAAFEAGFGAGLDLSAGAEISADRVGFAFDLGVGIGLYGKTDVDLSFSPGDMIDGIENDPLGALGDGLEFVSGGRFDSSGDHLVAAGVGMLTGGFNPIGGLVADVMISVVGDVGDALEDVPVVGEFIDVINGAVDVIDGAVGLVADGVEAVGEAVVGIFD